MTDTPRKTRLLFVCGRNQWRSPTAEALFAGSDSVEAISAGTNNDAEIPISGDLIDWADQIYVMERTHRAKVTARFAAQLDDKRINVLGIADKYRFMNDDLVRILQGKLKQWW